MNNWDNLFSTIKKKEYSRSLHDFLDHEYATQTIYPPRGLMFNAFKQTDPEKLKVVIIGQDPYHNPKQAMGMSFSVPKGVDLPPSLINIYKEIEKDLNISMDFTNGDLTCWAQQGVLLLNAYLTVRAGQPLSHKIEAYDFFMDDVLDYIETLDQPIVYMLWGGFAKRYKSKIKHTKHFILEAVHPSPLSANRGGWFGQNLFSKCNDILVKNGSTPIDWPNN